MRNDFESLVVEQSGVMSRSQALDARPELASGGVSGSNRRLDPSVCPRVYRLATVAADAGASHAGVALCGSRTGCSPASERRGGGSLVRIHRSGGSSRSDQRGAADDPGRGPRAAPVGRSGRRRDPPRSLGGLGKPLAVLRAAVTLERARRGHGVRADRPQQADKAVSGTELEEAFERNRGTWGTTAMRESARANRRSRAHRPRTTRCREAAHRGRHRRLHGESAGSGCRTGASDGAGHRLRGADGSPSRSTASDITHRVRLMPSTSTVRTTSSRTAGRAPVRTRRADREPGRFVREVRRASSARGTGFWSNTHEQTWIAVQKSGQGRAVRMRGPSAVMAMVCSEWAPREPSRLRRVQPSASV